MKKLVNLRTPLFLGASLIIGIVFGYSVCLSKVFSAIFSVTVFLASIFLYGIYSFKEGKRRKCFLLSLFFILLALFGCVSFCVTLGNFERASLGNHICDVTGRVNKITENDDYRTIILSDVNIGYPENVKTGYKISLLVYGDDQLDYGDVISFTALLNDRSIIYNGRFNVYDVGNGIKYSAMIYNDEYKLLESKPNAFESVRIRIRETLNKGLEGEEFSVVYALLTGNSDQIEDKTITNFRASGVAHIFAVSGLHIGFLTSALYFLFSKLKMNKTVSAVIVIVCSLFYSGVCGFSASSLRATIMCAVMLIASISGERYDGLSAIGIALIILLLLFPLQLFFAGFQLSFAVVLGILILSNPIAKMLKFLPEKLAISLSTVLTAQIVSVPIMIIHFGAFSIISVVVNLLFIPVVSIIFIFSLISTILSGILFLSWILFPLNYLIKAVVWAINIIDFTVFMVGGITLGFFVLFYYLSLFVSSGMINIKKKLKVILSICFACIFVFGTVAESLVEFSRCKIYSVTTSSLSASLIDVKGDRTLIVAYSSSGIDVSMVKKVAKDKGIGRVENVFILSGEEGTDAQEICSSLYNLFEMKNLYVYGERSEDMVKVMQKSFPEINLNYVFNGDIRLNRIICQYLLDGKSLEISYNDKVGLVFGDIDGKENYKELNGKSVDFAICYEAQEYLYSLCTVKNAYCYRYSSEYRNVQSEGTLLYYLK